MSARLLLLIAGSFAVFGCDGPAPTQQNLTNEDVSRRPSLNVPRMPSGKDIPFDKIETAIARACSLNIADWRRTYSFKWDAQTRRFATDEVEFYLILGPYKDLTPRRSWGDVGAMVDLDDRLGVASILGYYHLPTGRVKIAGGACDPDSADPRQAE